MFVSLFVPSGFKLSYPDKTAKIASSNKKPNIGPNEQIETTYFSLIILTVVNQIFFFASSAVSELPIKIRVGRVDKKSVPGKIHWLSMTEGTLGACTQTCK